jgi:transcriptional regulator with XRE-family HTH domain
MARASSPRRVPVDARVLREARRAHGWTQEQLARRSDVTMNTISRLERGERGQAERDTLRRLARALGVPMVDLIAEEEG